MVSTIKSTAEYEQSKYPVFLISMYLSIKNL